MDGISFAASSSTLLTAVCCLLCVAKAQADPRFSRLGFTSVPDGASLEAFEDILIINSTTWRPAVAAIANGKKQLVFSTFQGPDEAMLQMTANFYAWLHAAQVADNVMFLSQDLESCRMLWRYGLPCWYDALCPNGEDLPEGQYRDEVAHLFCKFWWGLKLVQAGYDVAFMDNDNVVISNPWKGANAEKYDFEGLSDFVKDHKIPSPQELLERPQSCVYKTAILPDWTGERGQRLIGEWEDTKQAWPWAMVPCMSTGLWFAHPTPGAALFLESVLRRLWQQSAEWEQAAVNEVLVAHLLNLDDREPRLRFRLLPHADYANLGNYQHELENQGTIEAIVAHPCCVKNKQEVLYQAHLWQSDSWQPAWGLQIVRTFQQRLAASPLSSMIGIARSFFMRTQSSPPPEFHHHHARWRAKVLSTQRPWLSPRT